jgi:hypothetical protein
VVELADIPSFNLLVETMSMATTGVLFLDHDRQLGGVRLSGVL